MFDLGKEKKAGIGFHAIQVSTPPVLQRRREDRTSSMATSRGPAPSQLPGTHGGWLMCQERTVTPAALLPCLAAALSILVTAPVP